MLGLTDSHLTCRVAFKEPEIVLDLSRLLSRMTHATPTGVDRCEMAYARGLLDIASDRLQFAAVHPIGVYGRLRRDAVLRFLDLTEERWTRRGFSSVWDKRRFVAASLAALLPRTSRLSSRSRSRVYVQASPNNLTHPQLMRRVLTSERAKFICLVHDLIPLEFPEYARTRGVAKHRTRVRTVSDLADGIITNSHATMAALQPWLDRANRPICATVAHLGTHKHQFSNVRRPDKRPYFICIGTIEPRKNHLLLLHLWRQLVQELGAEKVPQLIIVGRRGWENEQVVDMLERSPTLKGVVFEHNHMPDREAAELLAGARALLLPSFAEGYGMPVSEALTLGVPVLCSDLPALREVGGDCPEYLNPLDGIGWREAILNYLTDDEKRALQLVRLWSWQSPTWEAHLDTVLDVARKITV